MRGGGKYFASPAHKRESVQFNCTQENGCIDAKQPLLEKCWCWDQPAARPPVLGACRPSAAPRQASRRWLFPRQFRLPYSVTSPCSLVPQQQRDVEGTLDCAT